MFRRGHRASWLSVLLLAIAGVAVSAQPAQALPHPPPIFSGHVYNGASPRCLDSGVPANAQLWTCTGIIYQQWSYRADGVGRPIFGNSPSGCLDDGAGLNGSGVFLTTCNGSAHQRWYYYGGGGAIVNAGSGRCLDADTATIGHGGTKVQVWDCSGGANQYWLFEFENLS